MMGFTLSKLNLLIFVVAMAAIIIFFSTSLSSVMTGMKAEQIINRVASNASSLVASPTTCDSVILHVPQYINVFSGESLEATTGEPYIIKLTSIENPQGMDINYLVFSIALANKPDNPVSAVRLQTKASIHLFDLNYDTWRRVKEVTVNPLSAETNPTGIPLPENRITLIKESLVNPQLYIYPCTVLPKLATSTCESYAAPESEVNPPTLSVLSVAKPGEEFDCFPLSRES